MRNRVPLTEAQGKIYKNPNNDPNGRWRAIPMTAQGYRPNQMYEIIALGGAVHRPPEGRCWSLIEPEFQKLKMQGRIYFGKDGNSQPNVIRYLSEVEGMVRLCTKSPVRNLTRRSTRTFWSHSGCFFGPRKPYFGHQKYRHGTLFVQSRMVPWTWWPHEEVGHTDEAKKEIHSIFGKSDAFDTPKPERLIQRVLQIATNENDLVLDSFLGSGTTAAVAHKMGRRYIGVEMGEHALTHCQPRLKKVVDGEQGGISEAVNWQGGGGFRFYKLGARVFDSEGRINPDIHFAHLAAHIWFSETFTALHKKARSPLLGIHNGTAYYLLYNGVLGDKRRDSGNVLTTKVLAELPPHNGQKVIYGEACRLGAARLEDLSIVFKQTPYDVKAC